MNETNIYINEIQFSWYDYVLFFFMLGSSVMIGIYFGCFGMKQTTPSEYLLGGKSMSVFPVAMSLIGSDVSGITVLAIPTDVYKYGATTFIMCIGITVVCLVTGYISLPVFHGLQLTSIYEYLMLRFNSKIRQMASLLYAINVILTLPIVIYGPALAFAQVTPVNLHLINPIICAMCIFYTAIGGLKAVIWTDTLQLGAMSAAMAAVVAIGISASGGVRSVFQRVHNGERLDIDFDINPTKRDTFWAILIGWTIYYMPRVAINQGSIQKFLSLPTLSSARKALIIFSVGAILCKVASIVMGLIIYAKYYDCDPYSTKYIKKDDQLLPFYVMDVANKIPGLPGLFTAGIFCAGLSTLSADMNSLSGVIYEDFISKFMSKDISEKQISNILKLIVTVIGIISTALVFVIEHLGGVFPLIISLSGITFGSLLGLFTLGMMFPSANSNGALAGSIVSLVCMTYIVIGNQLYKTAGAIQYIPKPTSIQGCLTNSSLHLNSTKTFSDQDEVSFLFRITHYYYTLIGALIFFIASLSVSWLFKDKKVVDEKLITPCMRWWIPNTSRIAAADKISNDELVKLKKKNGSC